MIFRWQKSAESGQREQKGGCGGAGNGGNKQVRRGHLCVWGQMAENGGCGATASEASGSGVGGVGSEKWGGGQREHEEGGEGDFPGGEMVKKIRKIEEPEKLRTAAE